jgi:octopine/nopaline transport system permease protein
MTYLELVGFGPSGWGLILLGGAGVTFLVSTCGFAIGSVVGALVAWAKLSGSPLLRYAANAYTTGLRGVPDLLVIYLLYFGGSVALSKIGSMLGAHGFIGVPAFASACVALGLVSGAYQAEAFRGGFLAVESGQLDAARSVGMGTMTMFRRVVGPQVLRFAIPTLGNLWQIMLKDSALVSITGVMELLHMAKTAAGATYRPFDFYITAAMLFLFISWLSRYVFKALEARTQRGTRRAA